MIPLAEQAIATGDPTALADHLAAEVREEAIRRFAALQAATPGPDATVPEVRAYTELALGLQVWSHKVHQRIHGAAHEHAA